MRRVAGIQKFLHHQFYCGTCGKLGFALRSDCVMGKYIHVPAGKCHRSKRR